MIKNSLIKCIHNYKSVCMIFDWLIFDYFLKLMSVGLAWKSAAKSNEKLVNQNYATLFLSWMPLSFQKISCFFFCKRHQKLDNWPINKACLESALILMSPLLKTNIRSWTTAMLRIHFFLTEPPFSSVFRVKLLPSNKSYQNKANLLVVWFWLNSAYRIQP